jgi:hypothetical protein
MSFLKEGNSPFHICNITRYCHGFDLVELFIAEMICNVTKYSRKACPYFQNADELYSFRFGISSDRSMHFENRACAFHPIVPRRSPNQE